MSGRSLTDEFGAKYVRDYNRGWKADQRGTSLESGDRAGASKAWEDGFLDHAAGRPKWHLARCKAHHNSEGGCGEA